MKKPKREELLGQERLLRGARDTLGRVEVEQAAVSRGHARVTPRSFPAPRLLLAARGRPPGTGEEGEVTDTDRLRFLLVSSRVSSALFHVLT